MENTQSTEPTAVQNTDTAQVQSTKEEPTVVDTQVQQSTQTASLSEGEQIQNDKGNPNGEQVEKKEDSILDLYKEDHKDDTGEKQDEQNGQTQSNDYDKYVFERDGVQASPEDAQMFKDVARELDLSQEKAQKLYNISLEKVTAINQQKLLNAQKQWEQAVVNDKEIGGQNFPQTSRNVKLALKTFGNETFSKLMTVTGLGSHPAVVKMLNKVGAAIGNDQVFINGNARLKNQRDPYPFYDNSPELK